MEASQRVGGWGDIPPVSPSMLHPERRKRLGSISTGDYTAEVNAISQTQIVRGSDRSEQKEVSPLSDAAGWIVVAAGNWRWSGELFTSSHSILTHTHTHTEGTILYAPLFCIASGRIALSDNPTYTHLIGRKWDSCVCPIWPSCAA